MTLKWVKLLGWSAAGLLALVVLFILGGMVVYSPEYVYRTLAWQESDAFDWQKFPFYPLKASSSPQPFPSAPDPRVSGLLADLTGAEDWEAYLAANQTQAFLVIHNGQIVYEQYFNDTRRDSIVTSFSVAKSFVSALILLAVEDGSIASLDDPVTDYLPELAARDPRFTDISIRDLLRMASGLEYVEMRPLLFNSDDVLTTYYPDQRKIALENTRIIDPPGVYFLYNKYHPQLLGMILERATGRRVTVYLQDKLWEPLGMEYDGSWSTDSTASDFEKMETGVNARALDFAKFGVLFLNQGMWRGEQILSADAVRESSGPFLPDGYDSYYPEWFASRPGKGYYNLMWWGFVREDGEYDFAAMGDKGQYIYISPHKDLVILRFGIDYGVPSSTWVRTFYDFASRY